jgi:hypothetical protein
MAQEDKAASMINKTSYVENCETSAVGRALGFLGIGIETSIATADEVSMAVNKQQYAAPAPESDVFGQAVAYVKNQPNKEARERAYEAVIKKYGDSWTQKQKDAILKFVK